MMMNAISHPQCSAMSGIVAGAASAPTDEPELKIDVENARSFGGKYSAVTLIAAGKFPASPAASRQRQPRKSHTETDATESATAEPACTVFIAETESTPSTSCTVPQPHAA